MISQISVFLHCFHIVNTIMQAILIPFQRRPGATQVWSESFALIGQNIVSKKPVLRDISNHQPILNTLQGDLLAAETSLAISVWHTGLTRSAEAIAASALQNTGQRRPGTIARPAEAIAASALQNTGQRRPAEAIAASG